ncbi:hypothetical protein JHK86_023687 [Glycine max]|nr:hypothetical protein JHK86_023687 [Glycine max]
MHKAAGGFGGIRIPVPFSLPAGDFTILAGDCRTWHINGCPFFVVGFGSGQWTPTSRAYYNLRDVIPRCTTQAIDGEAELVFICGS